MPQPPVAVNRSAAASMFSGRYTAKPSDGATSDDTLEAPKALPPGDGGLLPPTNLWGDEPTVSKVSVTATPPAKHSAVFGSALADDDDDEDENPYLEDTPYYLSTLKGKAEGAKVEVLVSPWTT